MIVAQDQISKSPVLVLCGGRNQVSLIQQFEDNGYPVVVADYLPDSPGHRVASYSSLNSAFDFESNLALAREHKICAVMTTGTDQPLVVMADIAAALNLPCYLTPETARRCTDKLRMFTTLRSAGVPIPSYIVVESREQALAALDSLSFPLVVKPVDSQGQRGVSVVADQDQLLQACESAWSVTLRKTIIIQQFVSGPEITITGWAKGGKLQLGSITDRVTYNRPPATGVCFQHIYPSLQIQGYEDQAFDMAVRITSAFELLNGPLYIQCILHDDQLLLVEATCRIGGGHEEVLVEEATGIIFRQQLMALALDGHAGDFPDMPAFPVEGSFNTINFLLANPGQFTTIQLPCSQNGFKRGACYQAPGYDQKPIVNGLGRVGYLLCTGDSRERMLDNAHTAYVQSTIADGDGNNLLFWPEQNDLNA